MRTADPSNGLLLPDEALDGVESPVAAQQEMNNDRLAEHLLDAVLAYVDAGAR